MHKPELSSSQNCAAPVEIWGGAEYTCNRVGDRYFDQMLLSGHADRISDLERFASLGIKTLRFGIPWERHACDPNWKWSDERFGWMRQAGVRPIVGLLHHGSGPRHTSLVAPEFPTQLADYARQVAERYPWVDAYTPVNEPHTTARFSGMYGVWYPHHRSRRSYLVALLTELKATVLSMAEIRKINPAAQLIQTDDIGRICGTEELRSVCDVLNERRWLPFDLLCGHVDRAHPMFNYMRREGISERDILWFADHPCPPSVIGVNYYVTSDRFLDHRRWLYPPDRGSSEGAFVDVELSRIQGEQITGFGPLITETWERYKIPVALTEVHLGGCVEQQLSWIAEAWNGVQSARAAGAQCVAFTFWALLGSFYWNCLVTAENGHYEPGLFDVRSGEPVPTPLAEVAASLARGEGLPPHAVAESGWWRDPARECFNSESESSEDIAA